LQGFSADASPVGARTQSTGIGPPSACLSSYENTLLGAHFSNQHWLFDQFLKGSCKKVFLLLVACSLILTSESVM
jgi:hypothetical protein